MSPAPVSERDPQCLFCRIVAEEIAAEVIFRDDDVVAFRDIAPKAPTHLLIIPTRHLVDAAAIAPSDGELLGHMISTAHRLAETEDIADGGYRLVFNVGEDAGNTVAHLHLHLLGGRRLSWPPG